MCLPGQPLVRSVPPATAAEAATMVQAGLAWLAAADPASLTVAEQADGLKALERAESMHTAARAAMLAGFSAQGGFEADGQGSAKSWLRWQTRITRGAASGAVGWMRRLAAHPAVRDALARGELSCSWARHLCAWSDLLPEDKRDDADAILLAAAAGGAELADLAALAEEIRRRPAGPDGDDGDDGFTDRGVSLDVTFGRAGRLAGDLTPQCAAALAAVLESLGKKAGPADIRTKRQRDHDATGGGVPAADRCRVPAGPGRATHPDPAAYDPG